MLNPLHCHQRTRPPRPLPPPKLRVLHPSGSLCPRHSGFPRFQSTPAHPHLPPVHTLLPSSSALGHVTNAHIALSGSVPSPSAAALKFIVIVSFSVLLVPSFAMVWPPVLAPEQGDVSAFASGPRSGPLSEGLCVMPGSQVQASEPRPTPSYSADIHKLTCCSPGGMAAWGHHAFHGETSSRGGLAAGRGDCMSPPSPPGGDALVAETFARELDFRGK